MSLRKLKNKIIIVLCLAIGLTLCSCGGSMTDESVRVELERLLPLSYEMNDIFWGKGLPIEEVESVNRYLPVKEDCGYSSIEQILDKADDIFSETYLSEIKDAIFTDSDDIDPRYLEIDGKLHGDQTNKGFNIQGNIKIDTAKIKKQNDGMIVVKAEYEDGGSTEITLVKQDGKWYLDSPTY